MVRHGRIVRLDLTESKLGGARIGDLGTDDDGGNAAGGNASDCGDGGDCGSGVDDCGSSVDVGGCAGCGEEGAFFLGKVLIIDSLDFFFFLASSSKTGVSSRYLFRWPRKEVICIKVTGEVSLVVERGGGSAGGFFGTVTKNGVEDG